jgi:hypothetical protein
VNDSPVTVSTGAYLNAIFEDGDDVLNIGTLVKDLVRDKYSDVDRATPSGDDFVIGIAVVGVDRRFGDWFYSCPEDFDALNGVYVYTKFFGNILENGAVYPVDPTPSRATLLGSDCLVKFVPRYNFNVHFELNGTIRQASDIPSIQYRGWDMTQLSSRSYGVNTVSIESSDVDNLNSFSREVASATIEVIAVNDLPTLNLGGYGSDYSTLFIEGMDRAPITDSSLLSLRDEDNVTLSQVMLVMLNVNDLIDESIVFSTSYVSDGWTVSLNSFVSNGNSSEFAYTLTRSPLASEIIEGHAVYNLSAFSYTLTLRSGNADASFVSLSAYEALLRRTQYQNINAEPENSTRVVSFDVFDGNQHSVLRSTVVHVRHILDNAPILDLGIHSFVYDEELGSPLSISGSSNVSLRDKDNNVLYPMARAVVRPISPSSGADMLTVSIPLDYSSIIQVRFDVRTTTLTIEGNAHISVYEDILKTLQLFNNESEPLGYSRVFQVFVTDTGGLESNIELITIDISLKNDNPAVVNVPAWFPFD